MNAGISWDIGAAEPAAVAGSFASEGRAEQSVLRVYLCHPLGHPLVIHLSSFVSAVLSILNFKFLFHLANLVMELGSLLQEELWRWDSQGFGNSNPIPQEDGPGFCSRGICSNMF